jgi:A/G-specific adenine glycosylase
MGYICEMAENTFFFHKKLILWYLQNGRSLPWRSTTNPYFIWLSEIMLQQTRVAQALPYYEKFIKAFPTINDLAEAKEQKVLKLWQGLGYYSRARNLHFTAKYISKNLDGKFPETYDELIKLKGVGDYTASAISSICFDAPHAVVDGNVYRVLARFFGISTAINSSNGIKEFKELAQELIDPSQPGTYNQAIMEFGARFCVPQKPNCDQCIFNDRCAAFNKGLVTQLPQKKSKIKIRKRYFNYIVVHSEDLLTIVQQRTQKGIWHRLFEFPLIETENEIDQSQLKEMDEFTAISNIFDVKSLTLYNENPIIHKLSHQHLHTRFWIAGSSGLSNEGLEENEKVIPIKKIRSYPVPVLIENFISDFTVFKI